MRLRRRQVLSSVAATCLMAGCAPLTQARESDFPPIIFVHGNGDSAALWQTTAWRFESNGWPPDRLFAIDLPYPTARNDDTVDQPGRTGSEGFKQYLAAEVQKVLKRTGARQVVLIGNSRGGLAIRNYIQNGGAKFVSHAVLGATPNHGVWAIPEFSEQNEFSGLSSFIKGLNTSKNAAGDEVTGPVKWLTLRSDKNDKYAQPEGTWIARAGKPTFVTEAGPELKGARNLVLPMVDHREASFSPQAFEATWQFLTGRAPKTTTAERVRAPVLNGRITGQGLKVDDPASGNFFNNLPISGAQLAIFETDPRTGARRGEAVYRKTVSDDGQWGPFTADSDKTYEFEVRAPGYAVTHIYRSPFPRGSQWVHLRAERLMPSDKGNASSTTVSRPRGYFLLSRDKMALDGYSMIPGIPNYPVAGVSSFTLRDKEFAPNKPVRFTFNGESVAGQTWNHADSPTGQVAILELSD